MLVKRNYKAKNVELMFEKVRKIDRKDILRVKSKELLEKSGLGISLLSSTSIDF